MASLSFCIFICIMATVAARYTTYQEYPQMSQYRFQKLSVEKNMDDGTLYGVYTPPLSVSTEVLDVQGPQDVVVIDKGDKAQITTQLPPSVSIRYRRSENSDSLLDRIHEMFADWDVERQEYGAPKHSLKGGLKGPLGENGAYHLGGTYIQLSPFEHDYAFKAGVKYRF